MHCTNCGARLEGRYCAGCGAAAAAARPGAPAGAVWLVVAAVAVLLSVWLQSCQADARRLQGELREVQGQLER